MQLIECRRPSGVVKWSLPLACTVSHPSPNPTLLTRCPPTVQHHSVLGGLHPTAPLDKPCNSASNSAALPPAHVHRYLVFNQRIMGRAGAFRGSSRDFGVGSFADCEFIDDDATHADSGAASEQAVAVEALHAPGGDTPEADGGSPSYFVAVMMGPTALEGGGRDAALVWPEPRPAAVGQVGLAETVAAGGGGGSGAAQGPRAVCEATITEHSPYGGATAGAARAASATGPDAAGGSLGVGNSTRYPQLPPPLPSRPLSPVTTPRACAPLRHHVPAFTNAAAYSGGTAGSTPRNPNAIRGGGPAYPAYPAYPAKASSHAAASIAGPTGHSGKSGTLGWSLSGQVARALSRLRSLRTRTGRSLSYADQALSLPQQMGVGLIVAAFILYPSLCQVGTPAWVRKDGSSVRALGPWEGGGAVGGRWT